MVEYVKSFEDEDHNSSLYRFFVFALDPGYGLNFGAFFVSLGAVLLLLDGVKESKHVTNFFSTLKVFLVIFIAVMSMILAKKENLRPFIPPEFGVSSFQLSMPIDGILFLSNLRYRYSLISGRWDNSWLYVFVLWVYWL